MIYTSADTGYYKTDRYRHIALAGSVPLIIHVPEGYKRIFQRSEITTIENNILKMGICLTGFIQRDVAETLGYKNTKDALAMHVDNCDKIMGAQNATPSVKDSRRDQYPTWINESGLYALIFGK